MPAKTKADKLVVELMQKLRTIVPGEKYAVAVVVFCVEDQSCCLSSNVSDEDEQTILKMALSPTLYSEVIPDEPLS